MPRRSPGLAARGLGKALLRAAGSWGAIHAMLGRVSRVTGLLRDQVTGEMHAVTARGLREVEDALGRTSTQRREGQALDATFAGDVARPDLLGDPVGAGGGEHGARRRRLFLDLGRRVERAQAVADQIACALEFPGVAQQPARVEHGLRLALELCDSSITYRSRYLAVLQPAPALDLMLADDGNPRGLAFQLAAMRALLSEIAGSADNTLAVAAAGVAGRTAVDGPHGQRSRGPVGRGAVSAGAAASAARRGGRTVGSRVPPLLRAAADGPHGRHRGAGSSRCAARHDLPRAAHDPATTTNPRSISGRISRTFGRVALPHQRILRAGVHAAPAVSWRRDGSDHFGNEVTWLFLDVAHAAFQVIADATVDVGFPDATRSRGDPAMGDRRAHARGRPAPRRGRPRSSCLTARARRPIAAQRPTRRPASRPADRCWRRCSI